MFPTMMMVVVVVVIIVVWGYMIIIASALKFASILQLNSFARYREDFFGMDTAAYIIFRTRHLFSPWLVQLSCIEKGTETSRHHKRCTDNSNMVYSRRYVSSSDM
jgi:hypothetical protein